ncbi:MAG: EamA family transporter [Alphaproteobacteria bacterium]
MTTLSSKHSLLAGCIALGAWSSSALIIAFSAHITPLLLCAAASFIGFIFCLMYWFCTGSNIKEKFAMSAQSYLVGTVGIAGYSILWICSLKLAPPFEANCINYLWPALLLLFSSRMEKIKLSALQSLSLLFSLCGVGLIFLRHWHGIENNMPNVKEGIGLFFALAAAIIWAIYSTILKKMSFKSESNAVFLLITAILSGLLSLMLEKEQSLEMLTTNILPITLLGFTRISYIFWDYAMKNGQQQNLAVPSYLVPVLSLSLLALFTPTPWSVTSSVGAIFIVFACLLAQWPKIMAVLKHKKAHSVA